MLNNFEEIIFNGHNRKGEFQHPKNFIYSPESLPKHILDIPYDLKTAGPKRFIVNTKKKIKIKEKKYSLTEIWPTGAAGRIIGIVPLTTNGKMPSFVLSELGKPIILLESDSYQFNFIYGNKNNAYSINLFPRGKIEELRKFLRNASNLENLL